MKLNPATVRLSQGDIEAAIRRLVEEQGYRAGAVTIDVSHHQINGPSTFSATVEVTPVESSPTAAADPQPGAQSRCQSCHATITFAEGRWHHMGAVQPRHPARPTPPYGLPQGARGY